MDKCWEGPYAVVSLIGPVIAEIRRSRRAKSKVIHVDKLAHTKIPIDMSWVRSLPTKMEAKLSDDNLQGVKKLFDENQPVISDNNQNNNQSYLPDESADNTENLHIVSIPNDFKDNMVLALTRCDEKKKLTPKRDEESESVNLGQELMDFTEPEDKNNSSLFEKVFKRESDQKMTRSGKPY